MHISFLSSSAHLASFGNLMQGLLDDGEEDLLFRVLENIKHIASNGGHPQPPVAKPLRGHKDLCEIRTTFGREELLRVYYFVDRTDNKIVLLNAITKPDGDRFPSKYEGNAGKKLHKKLQESIDIAVGLQATYHSSKESYESFPQ